MIKNCVDNRLRGTTTGANNRMDLLSIVTSGVTSVEASDDDDILGVVERWEEDETHDPDVPAVSHRRGLTPFVFVPFDEVNYFICTKLSMNGSSFTNKDLKCFSRKSCLPYLYCCWLMFF